MKQYIPMSEKEVWSFLDTHKIMVVATVSRDGKPHNTPIWFVMKDGNIYFRAQHYKRKVRNLTEAPWVSCVVEDGEQYTELRGVMIQGKARVVEEESVRNWVNTALAARYRGLRDTHRMPADWREQFEKEPREIIEIHPVMLVSWDNRKWLAK